MLPEIESILSTLDDARLIRTRAGSRTPLDDLLRAYTDMTLQRPDLPTIGANWQGSDLKKTITALNDEDQATLVSTLRSNAKVLSAWEYQETPAERDNRQLNHWLIKVTVLFAMCCFLMLTAAVGWAIYSGGMDGNEDMMKALMDSLMQILKIVFNIT